MNHDKEFYENLLKEITSSIYCMGMFKVPAKSFSVSIGLFKEILVDMITLFEKLEKENNNDGNTF